MHRRELLQAAVGAMALGSGVSPAWADGRSAQFERALAADPRLQPLVGVNVETLRCDEPVIRGRWPAELCGRFWRNGPAVLARGGERIGHWFEGDGMVQRFAIDGSRSNPVSHLGRVVQTQKLKAEAAAGRTLYRAFAGRPDPAAVITGPDSFNVANTNALEHGGRLLALWEGGSAHALDAGTLATGGPVTWQPGWEQMPFSAHPKLDPSGVLWNFGTARDRLVLYRIGADGRLADAKLGRLPVPAGMVHDAAVTERWFVIPLPPLRWAPGEPLRWLAGDALRILLVDKNDPARQVVFESPAEMVFHVGNAHEHADGRVELTYMGSAGGDFLLDGARALMAGEVERGNPTQTVKVLLDPATGRIEREAYGDDGEFPRVHPHFIGRASRFLVGVARRRAGAGFAHGLQWRDLRTGQVKRYDHGPLGVAEEAVVVPKPGRSGEHEAWLLATMYDAARGGSSLQLFEASRLEDGPIAIAELPYALPYGFHGNFQAA